MNIFLPPRTPTALILANEPSVNYLSLRQINVTCIIMFDTDRESTFNMYKEGGVYMTCYVLCNVELGAQVESAV